MIDKLKRLKVMKFLSVYYQNENVSPFTKELITEGLLSDDNLLLHEQLLQLKPKTVIGSDCKKEIFKIIEEDKNYGRE